MNNMKMVISNDYCTEKYCNTNFNLVMLQNNKILTKENETFRDFISFLSEDKITHTEIDGKVFLADEYLNQHVARILNYCLKNNIDMVNNLKEFESHVVKTVCREDDTLLGLHTKKDRRTYQNTLHSVKLQKLDVYNEVYIIVASFKYAKELQDNGYSVKFNSTLCIGFDKYGFGGISLHHTTLKLTATGSGRVGCYNTYEIDTDSNRRYLELIVKKVILEII